MSSCAACLIAFVFAFEPICAPESDADVPVAASEVSADATQPVNRPRNERAIGIPILGSAGANEEEPYEQFGFRIFGSPSELPTDAGRPNFELSIKPQTPWKNVAATYNEQIAAKVNGERILNGEVLSLNSIYAFNAQPKGFVPVEYVEQMDGALLKDLSHYIQRRLIIEEIASRLPIIEVEKLQTKIRRANESWLAAKPLPDLDEISRDKRSIVLLYVERNRSTSLMAHLLLSRWIKEHAVSEKELLSYYHAHTQDYFVPAQVEWEQIQISFFDEASKVVVHSLMQKAQRELANTTSTAADAAIKYSDGPTAKHGGKMSTAAGSLTDPKLEQMLFEMPLGAWSPIYEGPTEFQLVRVQNRQPAKQIPFAEVEDKIRRKLTEERIEQFVKKLYDEAKIKTEFELPTFTCFEYELPR